MRSQRTHNLKEESVSFSFFFFQAEDGIRDVAVTGVQTCALPIYSSLGRRTAGTSYQHEIAPKKRPRPYRTRPANGQASQGLVSRKTVYHGCGRLLRHNGRLLCGIYPPDQPHQTRCGHLRIAQKETQTPTRSQTQTRQTAGNSDPNSLSGEILAPGKDSGTRQNEVSAFAYRGGTLVQSR